MASTWINNRWVCLKTTIKMELMLIPEEILEINNMVMKKIIIKTIKIDKIINTDDMIQIKK